MSLSKHSGEQGEDASAEGAHIIIPMFGAIRIWCGEIEVGKGEVNGKLTI